jgi:AhpD family alkylhydroperoxidase
MLKPKNTGLVVASAVLRCDDCVKYHRENHGGVTKEEMMEAMELHLSRWYNCSSSLA